MTKNFLLVILISSFMLSFLSTGIAKDDLDLDFSIKLNLEWEDIYTEHTSSTGIQEFFGDNYFENGYLVIYIKNKKRDKNTGINLSVYPNTPQNPTGRYILDFFFDRKLLDSWNQEFFLSYDDDNVPVTIESNQTSPINQRNGSIQLQHQNGFFAKIANDQVLDIFRRGGKAFIIEATDIEENFVNYRPAQVLEVGWSFFQLDISLVTENTNGLKSAFGGVNYDKVNLFIPMAIESHYNTVISSLVCPNEILCNRLGDKFAWSYGDNAETSFSAQAYANQEIFGGVGSTTDLVQQAINYFEAANTDLRDAFLNATTTTNTHRTLQTAYNEGKSAWEGIIALLDNTTDICHFSLKNSSADSSAASCTDSEYNNRLLLLNQNSSAANTLYRTARNYKTEYYDLYLAAKNDVSEAAALLSLSASADTDYQNGLTVLNNILTNSLLAASGDNNFIGYTQASNFSDVQTFYNAASIHNRANDFIAPHLNGLNAIANALQSTNNNLAFKLQWGSNRLSLGLMSAVGQSKIKNHNYEAKTAMTGLGIWYLVGKRFGLFINGFQNQIQTDFQHKFHSFFSKNEQIINGMDYGIDITLGENFILSLAHANGYTALKTVSNDFTIQARNEYSIFEVGCKTKLLTADLKIGYANTIEKGKSDAGISYTNLVDVHDPLPVQKLANGEVLETTQVKISIEQKF